MVAVVLEGFGMFIVMVAGLAWAVVVGVPVAVEVAGVVEDPPVAAGAGDAEEPIPTLEKTVPRRLPFLV